MGFEHDEAEWIRLGREGDPEALGALVERYQRMVHAVTFRMTGSMAAIRTASSRFAVPMTLDQRVWTGALKLVST